MTWNGHRCQAGFTLTELVLATGLVGFLIIIVGTILYMGFNATALFQIIDTRDSIQHELIQTILDPRAIRYTQTKDPSFATCFTKGPNTCLADGSSPDFTLYDASMRKVAGTAAAPVYYTASGELCVTPACRRKFAVTVTYRPQGRAMFCGKNCRGIFPATNAKNNRRHDFIEVRYSIQYLTSGINPGPSQMADRTGSVVLDLDDPNINLP
jgi:hypothetical protein